MAEEKKLYRVRFKTREDDYRPVNWPIRFPYWCTGVSNDAYVIVAYADSEEYIRANWPEAFDVDVEEVETFHFSSRFEKPDWFKETGWNGVPSIDWSGV